MMLSIITEEASVEAGVKEPRRVESMRGGRCGGFSSGGPEFGAESGPFLRLVQALVLRHQVFSRRTQKACRRLVCFWRTL
jgi:hypothetical protein